MVTEVLGGESVLSPSDLYNRRFGRAILGGYQPAEVDAFLERVADVLENLIGQVRELKSQQETYRVKLDEYRQIEETLCNALVTSQKFGENLIDSAKREAQTIVDAATVEKARVLAEAERLPLALKSEIRRLQELRDRLYSDMLSILNTHRALLDNSAPQENGTKSAPFGSNSEEYTGDTEPNGPYNTER